MRAGLPGDAADDYRIAILLHDAHGLSNPEIAELLGCSLATAKIRVHRARARLRETLNSACSFEIDERGVLMREMLAPHGTRSLVRLHGQSIPRLEASRRLTNEPDSWTRGASRRDARVPFQATLGAIGRVGA